MMGRPFRPDYSWIYWVASFVFAALWIAYLCYEHQVEGEACERRGGTYFCPYKSSCICLAKGMVLQ